MMRNSIRQIYTRHENGVVLFVALIALVVLSLAAVALVRSVDTNMLINENLTFKQDAKVAADSGVETAITWLKNNPTSLTADSAGVGFYSVCTHYDVNAEKLCMGGKLTDDASWKPGVSSAYATGEGITAGKDANGNTIQYIVERMCKVTGEPTIDNCQYGSSTPNNGGSGGVAYGNAGAGAGSGGGAGGDESTPSPVYRVTVKVSGPKNTLSYIQAFVF